MGKLNWRSSAIIDELIFKYNNCHRISYVVVDSLLGLVLMYLVASSNVSSYFWPYLHALIERLDMLIDWMTQYPAGLKLNDQLNEVLASFFKYHIRLWKTYIATLKGPLMDSEKYVLSVAGASLLFAAFSDILRLVTIHVFCFHLYTLRKVSDSPL
ncbi:n-acetylglucosaminyl transferase component (Gpi1) domain-containing protein [Ditylenchus destructor]|uniref:N-acetylglucosaminyl transferase component (Gpi1) domain-containing protein n=1 Tax=Ditylenchus destructor TaxID=166010 RepID=A0AAD4N738_9BILA|nr:n-acetylglucosaminyl transferase component (Gpi1) domain-containing protein [Ditylenchus destructor]